ncbi:MAG TPA: tRNA (adenosine(37)-N6)-dimethylallyltransferase MiaA [Abditibacteriaceae bacterium]|nr:tRNA (adenosine(37)-N6)-dimethylallyltransferase MiaA [Abditibacteriaceae bacterium]
MTPKAKLQIQNSPLLFLVGPTASGKTRLGVKLSTRIGGEIVSMDSMQIYRTLDIGTGKPAKDEQAQARHHLLDIKDPHETYSAAQWAHDAGAAIKDIRKRGKVPIIVGGTGFYARALLQPETLAATPPNEELRAQLGAQLQQHGAQWLHWQLRVLDAVAAERLEVGDTRRVIRAIEVAASGQKSAADDLIPAPGFQPLVFGLEWPREILYRRIEDRIEQMLDSGFMDELQRLVHLHLPPNATALQSLGYRQMSPALGNARCFDQCLELWKRDTRRYAKRQMTWFRHQLPTQWMKVDDETNLSETADSIVFEYSKMAPS